MAIDLPFELRVSAPGGALVYPSPGPARGDLVAGQGTWVFRLEPGDDDGAARIRVDDVDFRFLPGTCVHADVDGDGLLERLDLSRLRLDRDHLDLAQTGGTLDLRTGDVVFRLVFDVQPGEIPGLERVIPPGPIHFDLTERGRFDLTHGRYRTNSDVLTIPDGPLAGLTVLNCIDKLFPYHHTVAPATVALGVCVLAAGVPSPALDIPAGQAPKAVWICPGTTIRLAWESTGADAVEIDPDLGEMPPDGAQIVPDPASPNTLLHQPRTTSTVYRAVTRGDREPAEDHVTVNVIGPAGEWFSQKAVHVDGTSYWSAFLPDHTYDPAVIVSQVVVDTQAVDSVTHPHWRVDHRYDAHTPVGTPIPSPNVPAQVGDPHALPGEYRFTPWPPGSTLPAGEHGRSVHFRLHAEACDSGLMRS